MPNNLPMRCEPMGRLSAGAQSCVQSAGILSRFMRYLSAKLGTHFNRDALETTPDKNEPN